MSLVLESGYVSLNKYGEELCGDKVETIRRKNMSTLVLADGLGSGVKANILSTLTSKILCTMISNDISLEECIETIISSLPVCKVRGVAYSTFSIIHIDNEGRGYLVEFDNPMAILVHEGRAGDLDREKLSVAGKTVYKSELRLAPGDIIVVMSDGVVHAGIGMLLNFGWQREDIVKFINERYKPTMSARCLAGLIGSACKDLYLDKPGDDTTIAAVRVREEKKVSLLIGPPVDKSQDDYAVCTFLGNEGKKVVCGGTSSQIVARYLNTDVSVDLDYTDKDIPPTGHIKGIDLVTEGVITLRRLLELAQKYLSPSDVSPKYFDKKDGASQLANVLFEESTDIKFYVGRSVNVAHQGLPIDTTMKLKIVENLSKMLREMGKNVEIYYF